MNITNYQPKEDEQLILFDTESRQDSPIKVSKGKTFTLKIRGIEKWYLWSEDDLSIIKPTNISKNTYTKDYYPIYDPDKTTIKDAHQYLKFYAHERGEVEISIADDSMVVGYTPKICNIKINVV